ncbi:YozE family protein [Staphylococcus massiliensis]|uniref:YozE SAM-like domain-containing protein n=1 Tax=Staphylococcus massiliensis S46 TaxID=1229783 RepID=K9AN67_9STAP|nr:YozE family protein [Staphylococcus massiliensis]EKU47496.1 hypothetical protein C273_07357 [Staphylococcus massiliensis S46]MCG3398861.1 YozE family protein [Staphylococcus massiliensis]MCG3401135.1 YozE family protein [Staphylococcus massiliensis]MCG3412271.1 YozE family protein [Staphylococcus massiliensis]POA00230.1 YozE family protein [Staphylococcus massiliensis CCUG 55927]
MKDYSFYQFIMAVRNRPNEEGRFAEMVYNDLSFPKQESDFNVLSDYIETSSDITLSMSVFDDLYEEYQEWLKF